MARAKFKMWRAPLAILQQRLDEGEVAIVAEDGTLVRRPDGQPQGVLEVLGRFPNGNLENSITIKKFKYTATAGQTVFTSSQDPFVVGMTFATVNGVDRDDFQVLSAGTARFTTPLAAGNKVEIRVFSPFYVADTYTRAEVDALLGNLDNVEFYTKVETDGVIALALTEYYTKTEIDNVLAGAVNASVESSFLQGVENDINTATDLVGDSLFIDNGNVPSFMLRHNGTNYVIGDGGDVAYIGGMRIVMDLPLTLTDPVNLPSDLWMIVKKPDGLDNPVPELEFVWVDADEPLVYDAQGRDYTAIKINIVNSPLDIIDLRNVQNRGNGLLFNTQNKLPTVRKNMGIIPLNKVSRIINDGSISGLMFARFPDHTNLEVDSWVEVDRVGEVALIAFDSVSEIIKLEVATDTFVYGSQLNFTVNVALRFVWNGTFWEA